MSKDFRGALQIVVWAYGRGQTDTLTCVTTIHFASTTTHANCNCSPLIKFRVSRRRREMYCGHARLCVCLSAAVRQHYCTDPDVTCCALLGGFAIGARVALLWQHNANPSYKLASIPRYDDSANGRLGGVCARCWPVTGG